MSAAVRAAFAKVTHTNQIERWLQARQAEMGTGKNLGHYAASRMGCWPNPSRRSSTAALTCSTRWAPLGVQRIC